MLKKASLYALLAVLCAFSLLQATDETASDVPVAEQALSPALSKEELEQRRRQAMEKITRLEEARQAGVCSHLGMLTAQRRLLQTRLSLLRRPHPRAPLTVQEGLLAEEIAELYERETGYMELMAEQGLLPKRDALKRQIEATRFRRDLALLRAERSEASSRQKKLCALLKMLLLHLEEETQQAGVADGAARAQAEGQWREEEARWNAMSQGQ